MDPYFDLIFMTDIVFNFNTAVYDRGTLKNNNFQDN
jgi:hypothetical protein